MRRRRKDWKRLSDDINYKRCRCPKWINGILGSDGPFSRPESALVTVKEAVARFLNSKRNENLAGSTLDKLTTIFEVEL